MRRRGVWGRGGTEEEADELKAQEEPEAPADGPGALHSLGLPFSIWSETSSELSKSRPEAGRAPSWAGEGQQGRGRSAGGALLSLACCVSGTEGWALAPSRAVAGHPRAQSGQTRAAGALTPGTPATGQFGAVDQF